MKIASVSDYRKAARRRLPRFLFEYIDGGSYDETTLRRNRDDLQQLELRQRVMRDISTLDLGVELFGRRQPLPFVLGPIGLGGMMARRGEVQAARAAQAANIPFTLSTVSACGLSEVSKAVATPPWFQLYMIRDRGFMKDMLAQARAAACPVLMFTVDMPVPGSRYRDVRSGLAGASGPMGSLNRFWQAAQRPGWAWDVGLMGRPHSLGNVAPVLKGRTGLEDFFAWMRANFDPRVTWDDLAWVREQWPGPIVVKGVMDVEDAREAVRRGCDGVVVSNHGGRQLDGAPSTARALPAIADAVGSETVVLADGGVRSGLDAVKLIALGARAVVLGRAWIYALGARGGAGVSHVIDLLTAEMRVAMALTGSTAVTSVTRDILVDPARA